MINDLSKLTIKLVAYSLHSENLEFSKLGLSK